VGTRLRAVVATLVALGACTALPPVISQSPTATSSAALAAATAAPSPTITPTTVLLSGTFSSVRFPPRSDLPYFGGHILTDGRYLETALTDGRDMFEYTLLDLSTSAVRRIDVAKGDLGGPVGIDAGRIAISRWTRTTTGEAFDYVIEDAATKTRTLIDHSDAPGIFHGEGAPAQPDPAFELSGSHVAFNHLSVEDGVLWVDLRVGSIGATPSTVLRTRDLVGPVALSDTSLAYTVMSRTNGETQLRLYDVATRRDTLVSRGLMSFTAALGPDRLLYYARPFDATPGRVLLRDLATGGERQLASGSCADPSLNERYAAITCGAGPTPSTSITVFDLATGQPVEVAHSSDAIGGVQLLPNAVYWTRFVGGPPQALYVETLRY
jgi:hypothetical protein